MSTSLHIPAANVCGIPVSQVTLDDVLTEMDRRIRARQSRGYIAITNTESMYHALRRPDHFEYIRNADFSLCDGVGVIAAGLTWGHRIHRLNGPILQLECCRYGVARGWRHFFYGGKPGVAEKLAENFSRMFPGLIVAGTYCPPFRELSPQEDEEVVQLIQAARPDIVWVGLGLLKQERWIAEHLDRIRVPWMCGVGAAFDYHSGAVPWAPPWMRAIGCEWIYRLVLQPKLRAKRYWWSLIFVLEAPMKRLFGRSPPQREQLRVSPGRLKIDSDEPEREPPQVIRAGLIGLGKMGLSHQAILRMHPNVELVGVCDSTQYVLDVLNKYTGIRTFNDYRRFIDESQLDCVVIATPSRFHGEMVRYALEHGLHVFCEKPFCLDIREGERIAELAEERKLVNQVGYHYRHIETFQEARRLLKARVLGDIHHVRAEAYGPVVLRPSGSTWRTKKEEGGGCLYDYASHAVDLVNFLVGVPVRVSGVLLNKVFSRDVEDEVYASMHFANGATGQLAVNWSDESCRKMSTRISVWGTNGRMTVERQECQIYLRSPSEELGLPRGGWSIRYATDLVQPVSYYLRGEEYSRQIDHFVQCIRSRAPESLCSFRSALETDRVLRAVLESAQSGVAGQALERPQPGKATQTADHVDAPTALWR